MDRYVFVFFYAEKGIIDRIQMGKLIARLLNVRKMLINDCFAFGCVNDKALVQCLNQR